MVNTHWSDVYVGEPYLPQVGDCAALAVRVNLDQFGVEIQLPQAHATTLRDQAKQILELKDDLAIQIPEAQDGCAALFITRGRVCHIGVMCWIQSDWWVLHADQTAGFVVRQRLRDLTRVHYKLEGFYKWK